MEKFFIVTNESPLRQEYLDYKLNRNSVNEFVKEFMPRHGIESKEYAASPDYFYIVPTKADEVNLSAMLSKYSDNQGLVAFRKNSIVGRAWISERSEIGLELKREPFIPFFFNCLYGKSRNRIFEIDGTVYLHFEADGKINTPIGFQEILGSEFYRVIEQYEREAGFDGQP